MYKHLKNVDRIHRSICSLGSGNHYIEIDKDDNGEVYVEVHSGSRNLGQQVCKYYQKLAIDECSNKSNELKAKVSYLVTQMKLVGKQKDIQAAIEILKEEYKCVDKVRRVMLFNWRIAKCLLARYANLSRVCS